MSLSGVALFAAGLVAAAALAGCSDGDTGADPPEPTPSSTGTEAAATESAAPSSSAPTPTEVPHAPHQAGDCLDESLGEVPCTKPHKYEAVELGTLPRTMPKAWPTDVSHVVGPRCYRALPTYTGSEDADATRLTVAVAWPPEPDWKKGERWWSCLTYDVSDKPLTGSVRGLLGAGMDDGLVACLVGGPADPGPARYVPCSRPHRSQAVDTVSLGRQGSPPPDSTLANLALKRCLQKIQQAFGKQVGGGATYPSPEQWRSGDTTATCYLVTKRPTSGLRS